MANLQKGELDLEIEGTTYRLKGGLNALAHAESALSTPTHPVGVPDILDRAMRGHFVVLRAMFWGMLQKYHPTITLEGAGDLIEKAGGIEALNKELVKLQGAMSPDPRDMQELPTNPRKAQAKPRRGTGEVSTFKLDASA